jgi:hypothetical protein
MTMTYEARLLGRPFVTCGPERFLGYPLPFLP